MMFYKLIFLLVSILILSSQIYCQDLIVSNQQTQVIYQFIDNPIQTNLSCFNSKKELFTNNGFIHKMDDKTYWNPMNTGYSFLKLIEITKEDTIVLDSVLFLVKGYSIPEIYLNRIMRHSGIADYNSNKLIFEFNKSHHYLNLQNQIRIKSFDMYVTLKKSNGEIKNYSYHSNSEKIPKEFDLVKNQLKVGDTLYMEIKQLKVECDWLNKTIIYEEYYENIPVNSLKWTWHIY